MTRLTAAELQAALSSHEILSDTGATDMRRIGQAAGVVPTEREEQAAVIAWADAHPVAHVLHAIPNGQYRKGQRLEPGLRPGVPDLFLPIASDGYHGLYIELKRAVAWKVDDDQRLWIDKLRANGYQAVICRGADMAIAQIETYLGGDK